MQTNALIIFVKNPEPGKVKTRLAADLGDEIAFHIYLKLLRVTHDVVRKVDVERHVFYSSFVPSTDIFEEPDFQRSLQHGDDLGIRMRNAFDQIFAEGFEKAIIIGSDCPNLTDEHISIAFDLLDENDAVVGPAVDGGYYLLGLKRSNPILFNNKKWSSNSVLEDTIADFDSLHWKWIKIDTLSDVDTVEDLKLLRPQWLPIKNTPKKRND